MRAINYTCCYRNTKILRYRNTDSLHLLLRHSLILLGRSLSLPISLSSLRGASSWAKAPSLSHEIKRKWNVKCEVRCAMWRHTDIASATDIDLGCERYEKAKTKTKTKRVDYVEYSHLESEYTHNKRDWARVGFFFVCFLSLCFPLISVRLSFIIFSFLFLLLFRLLSLSLFFLYPQCQVIILGSSVEKGASIAETSQVHIFIFLFIFVIIFCAVNRHGNRAGLQRSSGRFVYSKCLPCHKLGNCA